MTKPSFLRTSVLFLGCLAFSGLPALAQHGGGHGGGGGHAGGGGGFHGGGGGFSGGGGVRSAGAAPRSGGGSLYRQAPAAAGGYRYPGYAGAGSSAYARGAQAPNAYRSEPGSVNASRDGQWHSFGNGNGATSAAGDARGYSGQVNGNWESFAGPTRGGATAGVRPAGDTPIRSFAGQGHDIVETTARPAVAAPNFAAARLGIAGSTITSGRLGGSPALFAGSTLTGRSNFLGAGFNAGFGFRGGAFGFNRFGFYNRFGFGRFGYGFRYPFYGFGWPFWGVGLGFYNSCPYGPGYFGAGYGFGYGYDPFAYDYAPCTGLWGSGYGPWDGNAYPSPGPYDYPYDYPPSDYPEDQVYPEQQGPPPGEQGPPPPYEQPPADQGPQNQQYPQEQPFTPGQGQAYNGPDINEPTEAQRNAMKPVQLYLKSGGVFSATVYWIADNRLNYVTDNGAVITVDIDQLDLQRTISENAKRGVPFKLTVQGNNVPPPVPANAAP